MAISDTLISIASKVLGLPPQQFKVSATPDAFLLVIEGNAPTSSLAEARSFRGKVRGLPTQLQQTVRRKVVIVNNSTDTIARIQAAAQSIVQQIEQRPNLTVRLIVGAGSDVWIAIEDDADSQPIDKVTSRPDLLEVLQAALGAFGANVREIVRVPVDSVSQLRIAALRVVRTHGPVEFLGLVRAILPGDEETYSAQLLRRAVNDLVRRKLVVFQRESKTYVMTGSGIAASPGRRSRTSPDILRALALRARIVHPHVRHGGADAPVTRPG
jgi:hypothetical protein